MVLEMIELEKPLVAAGDAVCDHHARLMAFGQVADLLQLAPGSLLRHRLLAGLPVGNPAFQSSLSSPSGRSIAEASNPCPRLRRGDIFILDMVLVSCTVVVRLFNRC